MRSIHQRVRLQWRCR